MLLAVGVAGHLENKKVKHDPSSSTDIEKIVPRTSILETDLGIIVSSSVLLLPYVEKDSLSTAPASQLPDPWIPGGEHRCNTRIRSTKSGFSVTNRHHLTI